MLTKILLTAAVILVVFWLVQLRQRREAAPREQVIEVRPGRTLPIGWLATGVVVIMLVAASMLLYDHWQDQHQLLQVRVVDTATGKSSSYRVYRGDMGEREFVTVNGVRVVLAETDRLESSTVRSGRN